MGLPPVRVELIAEIKEFLARMKEAEHAMGKVGTSATMTKEKMAALGQKMATGVIAGFGGTMVLATKYALEYQKSLEEIGLQANVSEEELHRLKSAVLDTSSATATSTEEIAKAYLQVEKAGIKGAAADKMVTQAAMLAKVAHADLNKTVQAGIVIQQLGISKGLTTTQMYDQLYGAVKNSKLSLDELTSVFQGKAALAISNYGIKLNEVAGVAGVFKKANMDAGAGMAGLQLALAKLTTRNSKANDTLKTVGLTQAQIAADLKKPNGLVTMFQDLSTHIGKAGMPMQQFLNSLVGARGGAGIGFLIKQLPALQQMSAGAGASVKDAFGEWLKNPEGAMEKFKTTLKNTLIKVGDFILPAVTKVLGWVNGFTDTLKKSPGLRKAFEAAMIAAVGAAFIAKAKKAFNWLQDLIGKGKQAAQLAATTANTAALEANTAALLGKGAVPKTTPAGPASKVKNIVKNVVKGSVGDEVLTSAGVIGGSAAFATLLSNVALTTAGGSKQVLHDKLRTHVTQGVGAPSMLSAPLTGGRSTRQFQVDPVTEMAFGAGKEKTAFNVTQLQAQAAFAYVKAQHLDPNKAGAGQTMLYKALTNFAKQDVKGQYSVTVSIK
jgi:TP901 family phage tail tape measure protein